MSDTIRCTGSLSPVFSWGNPTQRPNDDACRHYQRAFVVSVVVNRLPFHAHKEKNARRAGPGAFRVRCCEAQGFLSSATTRMWRDRLFAESRPLSGFGGKKKVRGTS